MNNLHLEVHAVTLTQAVTEVTRKANAYFGETPWRIAHTRAAPYIVTWSGDILHYEVEADVQDIVAGPREDTKDRVWGGW